MSHIIKQKVSIGTLINVIEEFKGIKLSHNTEVDVKQLGISIPTPTGSSLINYIIKKDDLAGLHITFHNGHQLKCAKEHILLQNGKNVFAKNINAGDTIDSSNGVLVVRSVLDISNRSFYDINVDEPNLYYDASGIIHHNTVVVTALSRAIEPYGRSIIIVPNRTLVNQTLEDYQNVGLDTGVFFGGKQEFDKTHTICTWQSLMNLDKKTKAGEAEVTMGDLLDGVVCVIVDEAHTCKGDVLLKQLTGSFAHIPIRWGLTGTIPKEEYQYRALQVCVGDTVGKVGAAELQDKGILAKCHVHVKQLQDNRTHSNYQTELKYLLSDSDRLDQLAYMIDGIGNGGNTLVLVDRISAGRELELRLDGKAVFLSGSTKEADRKAEYDLIKESTDKILIATYGIAAVGININRIFNLVLIEPGKSFIKVIQSIGRSLRVAPDKDYADIYDITSNCKFAKRHLTQRKKFYKEAQYPFKVDKINFQ